MSGGLGDTLHALGDVVDEIEAAGGTVAGIETGAAGEEGGLATTLDVELSLSTGADLELELEEASLAPDGTLSVRLRANPGGATTVSADGGERRPPTESAPPVDPADDGATAAESGSDQPAYKDPERLRSVYAAHDSFPAMTEALGVDVTPQTVRRHMIEQGIHDPEPPPESARGDEAPVDDGGPGATPVAEDDDGSRAEPAPDDGVPSALGDFGDISLEELKEAVRSGRTIHEVGQRLDVPRERAFRLLNTLGLIDLVSGRLHTADRHISAEELEERIERATAEE